MLPGDKQPHSAAHGLTCDQEKTQISGNMTHIGALYELQWAMVRSVRWWYDGMQARDSRSGR